MGMTAHSPAQYDAWYRTPGGRWIGDCEYRLLRDCLAVRAGESILDVGCGTGFFTRRFARGACSTVIGVDPDFAAIRYALLHAEASEAYMVARGETLPFSSRLFDVSISITALCFVSDQMQFLREMARVTRRRVAVGLLNRRSLLWHRKGHAGGGSAYHGAHWHTREEITELLSAAGLSNISIRTAINLPSGSFVAKWLEHMLPSASPWGGFMLAVGDVAVDAQRNVRV